jgi:foldase protein PrsA
MKKKAIALGAIALFSTIVLAGCGSSQKIATMKGQTITVEDFYKQAKSNSTNQGIVRQMIIYDVFDKAYGDKVKDSEVTKQFNQMKKSYGDQFSSALASAGYTTDTYKDMLKKSLAFEKGLESHVKVKDADIKTAWASYHPEVTADLIKSDSEDAAKKVLEEVKKDGADFKKIAKEKSTDTATKADGGEVKFDSTSTTVPKDVQTAAFKLKDGAISDVITVTDTSTYQTSYYIVKMVKNKDKGNDLKPYKSKLEKIAKETQLSDQSFQTKVIGEELKKANVKIVDKSFENILSDFMGSSSSSSAAKTTESTSTSSSK